jgi:hypothetical protein
MSARQGTGEHERSVKNDGGIGCGALGRSLYSQSAKKGLFGGAWASARMLEQYGLERDSDACVIVCSSCAHCVVVAVCLLCQVCVWCGYRS